MREEIGGQFAETLFESPGETWGMGVTHFVGHFASGFVLAGFPAIGMTHFWEVISTMPHRAHAIWKSRVRGGKLARLPPLPKPFVMQKLLSFLYHPGGVHLPAFGNFQ